MYSPLKIQVTRPGWTEDHTGYKTCKNSRSLPIIHLAVLLIHYGKNVQIFLPRCFDKFKEKSNSIMWLAKVSYMEDFTKSGFLKGRRNHRWRLYNISVLESQGKFLFTEYIIKREWSCWMEASKVSYFYKLDHWNKL